MEKLTEKKADDYLETISSNFENEDSFYLRKMSNELIEEAISSEDNRLVELSLVTYVLSKICLKQHYTESKSWKEFKNTLIYHFRMEKSKKNTKYEIEHMLEDVLRHITDFDKETGNYAMNIVEQVRIKQASRLYALGMSLSKSAQMTKVNKNELLDYVGGTKIHDRPFTQTKNLAERYKKAREVLE